MFGFLKLVLPFIFKMKMFHLIFLLCDSIAIRAPYNARLLLLNCCYLFCLKSQAAYVTWDEQQVSICRWFVGNENPLQVFSLQPYAFVVVLPFSIFPLAIWPLETVSRARLCFQATAAAIAMIRLIMMFPTLQFATQFASTTASKTNKKQQQQHEHTFYHRKRFHLSGYIFPGCTFTGDFLIFFFPRFLFRFPVPFDFVFTERIISDFNYIFSELILGKFPFASVVNAVNFLNFSFHLTFCSFICFKRIANNKVPLCTKCTVRR